MCFYLYVYHRDLHVLTHAVHTRRSSGRTPGEELWVKIIDLVLQLRRISLSIKQAAEGGVVAAEYQEHFGEQMYDADGNYVGPAIEHSEEAEAAWAEFYEEPGAEGASPAPEAAAAAEEPAAEEPAAQAEPEGDADQA